MTPRSQAEIDAVESYINEIGADMEMGDEILCSLVAKLGGNCSIGAAAGVSTTGTLDTSLPGIPVVPNTSPVIAQIPTMDNPSSWSWTPSPVEVPADPASGPGSWGWLPSLPTGGNWQWNGPPQTEPIQRYRNPDGYDYAPDFGDPFAIEGGLPGLPWGRGRYTGNNYVSDPSSDCPTILPMLWGDPTPPALPPAPVVTAPSTPPPPVTIPAPAPPPPFTGDCRTGNWCLDLMNGCVIQDQFSLEQLEACSMAGYQGNLNMFPAIEAQGGVLNGQFFGTPDPNPPPYTPLMGENDHPPGLSGFGQTETAQQQTADLFTGSLQYAISGLVAALAVGLLYQGRKR